MFQSPLLSPRESIVDRHFVAPRVVSPTQPQYFRDQNGHLKYSVDIDLSSFPEEHIHVTNVRNIVAIDAKYVDIDELGDERTHEMRRELYLPANVNPTTVTCVLSTDGILTIEADASEFKQDMLIQSPLSPVLPARMSRISTANHLKSPARLASPPPTFFSPTMGGTSFYESSPDPRRITFQEMKCTTQTPGERKWSSLNHTPPMFPKSPAPNRVSFSKHGTMGNQESILKSSQCHRSGKNVRMSIPSGGSHAVGDSNLQTTWRRGPSASPDRFSRQMLHFPFNNPNKLSQTNSFYANKRYNLRVEVGSQIRPEDLSVSVQNGVLVICAKRLMDTGYPSTASHRSNQMTYEHRSEHTLPVEVNPSDLTCRLENGVVFVDAPLSCIGNNNLPPGTHINRNVTKTMKAHSVARPPVTPYSPNFSQCRNKNMWPGTYA